MKNLRYLFALSLVAGLAACGDDPAPEDPGTDAGTDTGEDTSENEDTGGGDDTSTPIEVCDDGIDNDGDDLIDCEDPDCAADSACAEAEICDDEIDNDLDGLTDCEDPDCVGTEACPVPEDTQALCTDGVDNDFDGKTDCEDEDCAAFCIDCAAPGVVRGGECVQPIEGDLPDESAEGTFSYLNALAIPIAGTDAECCFDFNNDGVIDNALSGVLDLVGSVAGDVDVEALVADALEADDIALIFSWGKGENGEGFHIYLGTNDVDGDGEPDQPFAERLAGDGLFQLTTDAIDQFGSLVQFNVASVDGDVLTAGPSQFRLSLPIDAAGISLDLDLTIEQTTIEGITVAGDNGISSPTQTFEVDGEEVEFGGMKLGGIVPMDQIGGLLNTLASDCTCAGFDPALPVIEFGDDDIESGKYTLACAQEITGTCGEADGVVCENLGLVCPLLPTISGVLADLDTNNNTVPDAVSVGIRFGLTGAAVTDPAFAAGE